MHQTRILCLAGSNRSESFNRVLAGAMAKQLSLLGQDVTYLSLLDYPLPLFDADEEASKGLPESAVQLAAQFGAHDGIFITSPEYNSSLTPLLKNALDWISRVPANERHAFRNPIFAIGSASPGAYGGIRGLIHLRQILASLGALVLPEQISIPHANQAFDEKGDLKEQRDLAALSRCAEALARLSRQSRPYA